MTRLILALLLLCGTVQAAVGPIKSNNATPDYTFIVKGDRYFIVEFDASGMPVNREASVRFVPFDGPITPPPPPPPIDPSLSERAKLFHKAAKATGDPETGKKLAGLFLGLTDQVKSGAIKDRAKLEQVMSTALDLFLHEEQTKAKWAPVRKLLNEQWVKATQDPGTTLDKYVLLLNDAAAGLDASAVHQEAVSVATILKILTLILSKETLDLATILEILRLIASEL